MLLALHDTQWISGGPIPTRSRAEGRAPARCRIASALRGAVPMEVQVLSAFGADI